MKSRNPTNNATGKFPFKKLRARDLDFLLLYYGIAKGKTFSMDALRAIGRQFPHHGGALDVGALTRAQKAKFIERDGNALSLTQAGLWRAQRLRAELKRKGFPTATAMQAAGALDLDGYRPDKFTDDEISGGGREKGNLWNEILRDAAKAEGAVVDIQISTQIHEDLSALEGVPLERRSIVRRRAVWLAAKFRDDRAQRSMLRCDECRFDPVSKTKGTDISAQSLLDVHHKHPLEEGTRYTTATDSDFALLCPTCHRFEHAQINLARKNKVKEKPEDCGAPYENWPTLFFVAGP
jgi:predicted HNH restriction endonuclease